MPGQGGLQTIGRLRREWPAVKIVAMSGVKSAGAIDVGGHAVALGADRFLTKPFEAATLVRAGQRVCSATKRKGPLKAPAPDRGVRDPVGRALIRRIDASP